MLKTHAAPDTAPPTTQEIAQAIASLEARSASHADTAAQTVTVSEVINHLGLDMTAEDVLAEIHARRARQAKTRTPWSLRKKRIAGFLAGSALVIVWALGERLTPQYDDASSSTPTFTQAAFLPAPTHLSIAPSTLVQDTLGHTTILKTLAEIPDNHPVQCALTSEGFASGSGVPWTLIKHSGKVYLRCWSIPMSPKAMQQAGWGMGVTLFGVRGGFVGTVHAIVPLTVSLGNTTVQNSDIDPTGSYITVRNISLDSHAREQW